MFFFGGYRGFCKNGWILKISRGITIKIASRKRSFLFFLKQCFAGNDVGKLRLVDFHL